MQLETYVELERRSNDSPALPLPYIAILLAELVGLLALASTAVDGRPPLTYELGWAGCGSMLLMQVYSLRRRVRALRSLGSLRTWLDAHIFLGLQGFLLVAYHSLGMAARPTLAAMNLALVTIIVLSGVIGRYFYSLIWAARRADAQEHQALLRPLGSLAARATPTRRCRGLFDLLRFDHARRRFLRELRRMPGLAAAQREAAERASALGLRRSALDVIERWLAGWTLLHRPLAFLLLALTTLHVLAHFAYAV
ncbi:MAG: hypothetical protein R3B48_22685 [Kofleriaceae bacterium]